MYFATQWLDRKDGLCVPVIKGVYKLFQLIILGLHFRLRTPRHVRHFHPPTVTPRGGPGGGREALEAGQEGGTRWQHGGPRPTAAHSGLPAGPRFPPPTATPRVGPGGGASGAGGWRRGRVVHGGGRGAAGGGRPVPWTVNATPLSRQTTRPHLGIQDDLPPPLLEV